MPPNTFEVLPRALEHYRHTASHKTFLLKICKNLAQHHRRSAARRSHAMEGYGHSFSFVDEENPERVLLRRELMREVLEAIEGLPQEQREALLRAGVERRPAAEVAVIEGVPVATVRSRLFLARQKIQSALSRRGLAFTLVVLGHTVATAGGGAYAHPSSRAKIVRWLKTVIVRITPMTFSQSVLPQRRPSSVPQLSPARPATALAAVSAGLQREAASPARAALLAGGLASSAEARGCSSRSAPARPPAAPDSLQDLERYERAHVLHFTQHRFAEAEAAWREYLELQQGGRFTPEAEYNRGVALLRLGRLAEAQRLLLPFAEGERDGYRREDARRLMGVMERRSH